MALSSKHKQPAMPYAIALFYQPSLAAAIASGVKLPQCRPGVSASSHAQDVEFGIVLPLAHIHHDPTVALPLSTPNHDHPLLHSDIPLPCTQV